MLNNLPMLADQTESRTDQSILGSAVENPHVILRYVTEKDTKGNILGRGNSWMDQAKEWLLQVCPLRELKQTKEWEMLFSAM